MFLNGVITQSTLRALHFEMKRVSSPSPHEFPILFASLLNLIFGGSRRFRGNTERSLHRAFVRHRFLLLERFDGPGIFASTLLPWYKSQNSYLAANSP
jgi:hypothetical protein